METAEIARKALEILDRDGWNKGFFTLLYNPLPQVYKSATGKFPYRSGSHCIGGAWSIAMGSSGWCSYEDYWELWEKIIVMFPDWTCGYPDIHSHDDPEQAMNHIVCWNDTCATEDDVRAVLEKLAAS